MGRFHLDSMEKSWKVLRNYLLGSLGFFVLAFVNEGFSKPQEPAVLWRLRRASTCRDGYFKCNGSTICIEQRYNCDGIKDCEDGSDEWNCRDEPLDEFWNNLFKKRPDEDREKNTQNCDLSNPPLLCLCSRKSLFCENRHLQAIPKIIPSDVKELDLSGNMLSTINGLHLPALKYLQRLISKKAEISALSEMVFSQLTSLREVYLEGNRLKWIKNITFYGSKELRLLVLSNNPIQDIEAQGFKGLDNLRELDLRNCLLTSLDVNVFQPLKALKVLWLQGNAIANVPNGIFRTLRYLEILSLSRNKLTVFDATKLYGLNRLKSLSVSSNFLTQLKSLHFGHLSYLQSLDLQDNDLYRVADDAFFNLPNLTSLNMKDNPLKRVHPGAFKPLKSLNHVYFQDFFMCSYAPHVRVCEPSGDGISSFNHLLDNIILRVSVWAVAIMSCIGNISVLLGRLLVKETNAVHSFYIKNLSVADFLMGLYLFIIAGHDVAFRGDYIRYDVSWRHSWQCNFAGILSTASSEASVFILTIITADRYLSILYPLTFRRRTFRFACTCTVISWITAVLIGIIPVFNWAYDGNEFYGNNGVCLPLQIHDPFANGWQYSLFVFCGINSAAFLFILFAYIRMFIAISHSKLGLRCSQQQQDRAIAKRFAFIVGTDFVCWVPIIIVKLLAFGGCEVSSDLYAWVAVFLLPVNSALNPILYTLTTKLFKQQLAKIVYTWKMNTMPPAVPGDDGSGIFLSSVLYNARGSKSSSNSDFDRSVSRSSLLSANSRTFTRYNLPSPSSYIVYQSNYL